LPTLTDNRNKKGINKGGKKFQLLVKVGLHDGNCGSKLVPFEEQKNGLTDKQKSGQAIEQQMDGPQGE